MHVYSFTIRMCSGCVLCVLSYAVLMSVCERVCVCEYGMRSSHARARHRVRRARMTRDHRTTSTHQRAPELYTTATAPQFVCYRCPRNITRDPPRVNRRANVSYTQRRVVRAGFSITAAYTRRGASAAYKNEDRKKENILSLALKPTRDYIDTQQIAGDLE